MKLIVGLGNIGQEYQNTRHNIGFMFLDFIANKNNFEITKKGFYSDEVKLTIKGEKIIIIKPQTYMNNSGSAVKEYMDYYKLEKEDILVIHDDIDMPLMRNKLVVNSSSGGHNGIKSIEQNIGTKDYMRLKLGINSSFNKDTKNFVLGKFTQEELNNIEEMFKEYSEIIGDFIDMKYNEMANKYNRKKENE